MPDRGPDIEAEAHHSDRRQLVADRRFGIIPADRCLTLLRGQVIGRVAWAGAEGVQVLPVTYAVAESGIVFRTSPYGPLAELRDRQQVAFEIDGFDPDDRSGWSVVVHGRSRAATDAGDLDELWHASDPVPWAPGTRNLFIVITLDRLTGRTVAA